VPVFGNQRSELQGLPVDHEYMSFIDADFAGHSVVVCRSGYTGERGYELIAPNAVAEQLWDALVEAGAPYEITPAGLGARDTLRTEMGYPLHGQDITPEVTPVEAKLGWAVGWKKPAFWGREVLTAQREAGARRKLVGLVATGRAIPRPHMRVHLLRDIPLGEVTSGTFSPTLRKGVGLALLASSVADDAEVSVDVRGRREVFQITKPPFVDPSVREA
jgi:aminomethyltransferase